MSLIRYVVLIGLAAFAVGASAQNSPSQHQHTAPNLIDGSVHPEQIPDAVAYRLYLVTISAGPAASTDEIDRQNWNLQRAGLSDKEIISASVILANFKGAYLALIDQYNKSAEATNSFDGLSLFLAKRDALVQSTRDALKVSLTPIGMSRLYASVQREKANMKVAAKEAE